MADQIITCPHCQKDIPLTQALSHQLQAEVRKEYESKLLQNKQQLEQEFEQTQKKIEKELEQKIQDKLKKQIDLELKDKAQETQELQKRNQDFQNQILELTKSIRDLKKTSEDKELELQKKLLDSEDKIKEEIKKKSDEAYRLKELEYQKKLADVTAANDELRRKLEQGSQQTQGEVQELFLQQQLHSDFPQDIISEVVKGARGGDVIQEVVDKNGRHCGKILWESKQTKSWSEGWILKLKEDQRAAGADHAVIVSAVLPQNVKNYAYQNGVWTTSLDCALNLALSLRYNLVQAFHIKSSVSAKNDKKDNLYDYVTGTQFQHRVEAMMDSFQILLENIETEKRFFNKKWSTQEKSIRTLMEQTGSIHGELESIVGPELPEVKNFSLSDGHQQPETDSVIPGPTIQQGILD